MSANTVDMSKTQQKRIKNANKFQQKAGSFCTCKCTYCEYTVQHKREDFILKRMKLHMRVAHGENITQGNKRTTYHRKADKKYYYGGTMEERIMEKAYHLETERIKN